MGDRDAVGAWVTEMLSGLWHLVGKRVARLQAAGTRRGTLRWGAPEDIHAQTRTHHHASRTHHHTSPRITTHNSSMHTHEFTNIVVEIDGAVVDGFEHKGHVDEVLPQ